MSDRYTFRLQKVLKYREDREKSAQNKFARAENSLRESLEELSCLQHELMGVFNTQKMHAQEDFDLAGSLLYSRYAEYLTGCISNKEQTVQERKAEVSQERHQLETKMMERKILSNLKDKKESAFNMESKQIEQKTIDEMAISGFCRR